LPRRAVTLTSLYRQIAADLNALRRDSQPIRNGDDPLYPAKVEEVRFRVDAPDGGTAMRRMFVLAAGSALILPPAVLVGSPGASAAATTASDRTCAKTQHGLTVRIGMHDNGRFTRIRVSHPRGHGNFYEPRLHHVTGAVSWGSTPPPGPDGGQISGAARDRRHHLPPSFRSISVADGYSTVGVSAVFRLDNGGKIRLSCSLG
jgi:hypothetical protein